MSKAKAKKLTCESHGSKVALRVTEQVEVHREEVTGRLFVAYRGIEMNGFDDRKVLRACERALLVALEHDVKLVRAEPKRPDGCEGEGKCHGTLKWCSACGDVRKICDDDHCDAHRALRQELDDADDLMPGGFP